MNINHLTIEEIRKIKEMETNRKHNTKDTHKFYGDSPKHQYFLSLRFTKF